MPWYNYVSGSVGVPNSYTLHGNTPPNCPNPNNFLCAIQAADNNQKPILTEELVTEIADALQNRTESTNVLLKP
ncbi:hypothetical protein HCX49_12580 [Sphingobacterium kitahiroshimense]|uniref:hypothetical protein n=1 Tax=Sphingobacterium sp. B16(2022) TaxID=2914044 RepID=UPI00143C9299|nr:hypothetical protein [Sphingobacterium sp. B16(2022)]NJI74039.1 hypothetical protein [Sphingobacterium sp. B16(2022)]